jgi:L-ascorbate metabolism protein UlaG (beta-lactamase superfamily)
MKTPALLLLVLTTFSVRAQKSFTDTLSTADGDCIVHVLGHASVWFEYKGLNIYVDPYQKRHDFTDMVKADLLIVTHAHDDHFDTIAISKILKADTKIVYTRACADAHAYTGMDTIISNGDSITIMDLPVMAVPAYNITTTRHPRGTGNGYVIRFGDKWVYLSGDTEKIPEMDSLKDISLAFLPLSQPYNMTPEMMARTALLIRPDILVPYHYDNNDVTPLLDLIDDSTGIEVWTGITEIPSGFNNTGYNEEIHFYPNPASGRIYSDVFTAGSTAEVFDACGRLKYFCGSLDGGVLDIGRLPHGVYVLKVVCGNKTATGKLLMN